MTNSLSGNLNGRDSPAALRAASPDCRRDPSAGEALTPLEKKILKLLAQGKSSQEISALLSLSVRTLYDHHIDIMNKLNFKNPNDLVSYVINEGYAYKEI